MGGRHPEGAPNSGARSLGHTTTGARWVVRDVRCVVFINKLVPQCFSISFFVSGAGPVGVLGSALGRLLLLVVLLFLICLLLFLSFCFIRYVYSLCRTGHCRVELLNILCLFFCSIRLFFRFLFACFASRAFFFLLCLCLYLRVFVVCVFLPFCVPLYITEPGELEDRGDYCLPDFLTRERRWPPQRLTKLSNYFLLPGPCCITNCLRPNERIYRANFKNQH